MDKFLIQHLALTTLGMVLAGTILVLLVVWFVHGLVPEHPSRTPMAAGLVAIIVTVIFSVALNNLYALKRDQDTREWNMRQQHLSQLRPVLKQESDQLAGLADSFQQRGFLEGEHGGVRTKASELVPFLEPNVMSFDLANHFPEYTASKKKLEAAIVSSASNFLSAVSEAQQGIGIHDISWFSAQRLAVTYVGACMGRGAGFTLQVNPHGQGYSMSYYGASIGSSAGSPSPDLVYAYQRYRAFKPSKSLRDACDSLRASADAIESQGRELSRQALLVAQETNLRGDCPFVRTD